MPTPTGQPPRCDGCPSQSRTRPVTPVEPTRLTPGKAEDALRYLGADDLGRAARDRHGAGEQHGVLERAVAVETRAGPADAQQHVGHPLLVLTGHELGHAAFRAWIGTGHGAGRVAEAEQSHGLPLRHESPDVPPQAGVTVRAAVGESAVAGPQRFDGERDGSDLDTTTDAYPLVGERGARDRPARVHLSDDVVVRDEDVVEEDLVKHGLT